MNITNISSYIESIAPLSFQESYDNCGLIIGQTNQEIDGCLISLDITEEVIDEAIALGANLIISHHPLIFQALKKITNSTFTERCVIKAIQHNIAIYAAHTNMDSILGGVNSKILEKLGLQTHHWLVKRKHELRKLITYVPESYAEQVREALFENGAGKIGNYDQCSFNLQGIGTFRAGQNTKPFVGVLGKQHNESETRIETIITAANQNKIIAALQNVHPYEEVAYDIFPLENEYDYAGMGLIGEFEQALEEEEFIQKVKRVFGCQSIRTSTLTGRTIKKVAVCGGSGSSLFRNAISQKADAFISADFSYHQFFDADGKILLLDIGHFESEQFTKELFFDLLTKKFPTFAIYLSKINTNPIKYF